MRERAEAEKLRREEQARLDKERKEAERAAKEVEKASQALRMDRKRKIKGYEKSYKTYRKAAKKEDKLELDGEENVSTEGRQNFAKVLADLHSLDADIPDKDIQIILNGFEMHPEIADKSSIKFLISNANKKGGIKAAQKMVVELSGTLRDTKFHKPLIEYGRWMKKEALLPQIQDMKEQGMSNTAIGEKLGISSAEVSIIFHNDSKSIFPDFDEI